MLTRRNAAGENLAPPDRCVTSPTMTAHESTPPSGESVSDDCTDDQTGEYNLQFELEYHGQSLRDAFFQPAAVLDKGGSLSQDDIREMREAIEHASRFVDLVEEAGVDE